jgi:hypothetical protein
VDTTVKVWSWEGRLLGVVLATSLWSQWLNSYNASGSRDKWRFVFDTSETRNQVKEQVTSLGRAYNFMHLTACLWLHICPR